MAAREGDPSLPGQDGMPRQNPPEGGGKDGDAAPLVRLRMHWKLLRSMLEAHHTGYVLIEDEDFGREYLRLCLKIEKLLEDHSLAGLRARYRRPVDSLQLEDTDDIDWDHGIKQRCAQFSRMIEERVILANADDGLLEDTDLQYKERMSGIVDRHTAYKNAESTTYMDAVRKAMDTMHKPGSAAPDDGDVGERGDEDKRGGAGEGAAAGGSAAADGDTYDAFLSYSHDSKDDVARPLVEGLKEKGVSVWWDEAGMGIGDVLRNKIKEGIGGARHGIVVVSPGYLDSGWGLTELGAMFGKDLTILPILHGVNVEAAKKKLPAISEALMRPWAGSPKSIIDEIARKVKAGRGVHGTGATPVHDDNGGEGWKEALDETSRGSIAGVENTICGNTIERGPESDGIRGLLEEHGRVVVVGDKGSGKSALLRQVYESLAGSCNTVFVKADDFLGVVSFDELDKAIAPGRSFVDLVRDAARDGRGAVVMVDSLDSIARDKRTMAAFKQLIKSAWGAGAKTVVTIRSYDYRYSESIASTDWGADYELGQLSEDQVAGVMETLGNPHVPGELMQLLGNPLNLYIFSQIAAGPDGRGKDFTSIRNEINLYDAHWDRYVEQGPSADEVAVLLYDAARAMAKAARTAVPLGQLGDAGASYLAQSATLLRRVRHTGRVAFFHHAYLDYVLSRATLEDQSGVMGLLRSDEHNLFVRPSLPLMLAMAHERSPREFSKLTAGILRSSLKHYWKMAAAAALARVSDGSAAGYNGVGQLLTEQAMLQRHFLIEAAMKKNAFWLGAWGDTFLKDWAGDKDNPNGAFIVGYVRVVAASAASGANPSAFHLLRLIAENNQNGTARRQAVESMAKADAEDKVTWLKEASKSADVKVRSGVAQLLPGLLRTTPGSVPDMFANLLAYEETSSEPTVMADAGSMRFMGNPVQDNAMIKWSLERMFPDMLKDDPGTMIKAAVQAAERTRAAAPSDPSALFDVHFDAFQRILMPEGAVVSAVRHHLEECDGAEFDRLALLLAASHMAPFRSMLIEGMALRGASHLNRLVDELSDPRVYELHSMQASIKGAIGSIAGALDGAQLSRILGAIMKSNQPPAGEPGPTEEDADRLRAQLLADAPGGMFSPEEADYILAALGADESPEDRMRSVKLRSGRARAQFLAVFPEHMLGGEHLELVKAHRPRAAADRQPLLPQDFKFHKIPDPDVPLQSPEDTIRSMIGKGQDRKGRIALLESIASYLESPSDAIDAGLLPMVEQCLLESSRDPDPEGDVADEPSKFLADHPGVRSLAALCIARLVAMRGGEATENALRELSKDPSNLVRGGIARGLAHLIPARYDLAYPILLEYSRDPDFRVRFFLGDRFDAVINKDPAQASAVIENMLVAGGPPMPGTTNFLLYLALEKKDPRAAALLDRVAAEVKFRDIRLDMPFALKPYLSSPDHQGAALDLLYRMIEAGPDVVRSKAVFFAFNGIDGNDDAHAGSHAYARKVTPHLGLLASLFGRGQFDLQTAEHAVRFLEAHWHAIPEVALSCLEAVAGSRPDLSHQPALAQCTTNIISGMIELYHPGDSEWRRCLDVLDIYAAAGWPEVLALLAAMERPD